MVDDGESSSLCNGDENHKVWSGSQDHLDGIHSESPYDIYSGGHSTLGRPVRQRQISMPVQPPPPPKEEVKKKKEKKSKPVSSQSLSGTLIRPRPMHMNHVSRPPHPGMMIYGPPMAPPPHPSRHFHTIGHRGHLNNGPMHHQMHPQMPLPMPIMVPQQYATLQKAKTSKKKKRDKCIPVAVPMPVPPLFYPPPHGPPPPQHHLVDTRPLSMSSRKLAQSAAAGLDESGGNTSGAESPNGTGIYRRKGHLNERAFSYSIRQEHRSRSHGSLASLQFNGPDIKKEREIAQMVAGLEINGEARDDATLTRRSQMTNGHHPPHMNGHHMNGHHMNGHHMNNHQMNGHVGTFGKPRR